MRGMPRETVWHGECSRKPMPREHAGAMQQQGNGAAESRSDGVRERGQHDSLGTEQQVAEMRLRQENRSGLTPELSRPAHETTWKA
jgi:hypothetical protein